MLRPVLFSLFLAALLGCEPATAPTGAEDSSAVTTSVSETDEVSATQTPKPTPKPAKVMDPTAKSVLDRAVASHGADKFNNTHFAFTFRDKEYTFYKDGGDYRYTRKYTKGGQTIEDKLDNFGFTRHIDGQQQVLEAKAMAAGSESLNSVIYFATLPHKLEDPAVNLAALPSFTIKDQPYKAFSVSFDQEGGGKDYEDNFACWVNDNTGRLDYLAYDYRTNGGGVRFRAAYNPRVVDGILFQDYINYKAPVGTKLTDLPALYEQGKLKELSRIDTEGVRMLK